MESNSHTKENKEIIVEIADYGKKENESIQYKNVVNSNNNINNQEDYRSEEIERDLRNPDEEKFLIPAHLKKTFTCSIILFVIGAILIGIGFIIDLQTLDPIAGITFWCLGGIVMIPGGYYTYQFCKARRTKDLQDREDILNEIPEL